MWIAKSLDERRKANIRTCIGALERLPELHVAMGAHGLQRIAKHALLDSIVDDERAAPHSPEQGAKLARRTEGSFTALGNGAVGHRLVAELLVPEWLASRVARPRVARCRRARATRALPIAEALTIELHSLVFRAR